MADFILGAADGSVLSMRSGSSNPVIGTDCAKFVDASWFDMSEIRVGQSLPFPRKERDRLLTASDRWGMVDYRAGKASGTISAWEAYRQTLRDLPESGSDPWAVTWPPEPSA